jgi:hypothetical protein
MAVTDCMTKAPAATIIAATGRCAAGRRKATESKSNCKNNHDLTQHDELLFRTLFNRPPEWELPVNFYEI